MSAAWRTAYTLPFTNQPISLASSGKVVVVKGRKGKLLCHLE